MIGGLTYPRYQLILQMAKDSPLNCLRQAQLTADQLEILTIFINRLGDQKASDIQTILGLLEAEKDAQVVLKQGMFFSPVKVYPPPLKELLRD